MTVGHRQPVGVANVQLVLTESPLALGTLHRHPGLLQVPSSGSMIRLSAAALLHVVIFKVPPRRLEAAKSACSGIAVRLLEEVVLQLRTGHDLKVHAGSAFDLPSQHR